MSFVTSQSMFVWMGTLGQLVCIWLLYNYMNLLMVTLVLGFVAVIVILYKQVSTLSSPNAFCHIMLIIVCSTQNTLSFYPFINRQKNMRGSVRKCPHGGRAPRAHLAQALQVASLLLQRS